MYGYIEGKDFANFEAMKYMRRHLHGLTRKRKKMQEPKFTAATGTVQKRKMVTLQN